MLPPTKVVKRWYPGGALLGNMADEKRVPANGGEGTVTQ